MNRTAPPDQTARLLLGYVDPPVGVRRGDRMAVKVSTTETAFGYDVVRLVQGDEDPRGERFLVDEVTMIDGGTCPGRFQKTRCGSYGEAWLASPIEAPERFQVELVLWPTLPQAGHEQVLIAVGGPAGVALSIFLDVDGRVCLDVGGAQLVAEGPLPARRWVKVTARVDRRERRMTLDIGPPDGAALTTVGKALDHRDMPSWQTVRLAAAASSDDRGLATDGFFNGKLEAPLIDTGDGPLAAWDLGDRPRTWQMTSTGALPWPGHLVNAPARAVTGHSWTGEFDLPEAAPHHYRAIHFHEDDLADARWETDCEITLPAELPSGIYAVRLVAGTLVDHVPFFVGPHPESEARIAFLAPTYTYQAYANDRLSSDVDFAELGVVGRPLTPDWREALLEGHPEFGRSLYAHHLDGSGVCYSTLRRPVATMRPDFRGALAGGLRLLGADLYITRLLERLDLPYEVITDHELHDDPALLARYDVVVTGAHPEYTSNAILDAIAAHTENGGGLLYLGGNGFYWVTSRSDEDALLIEVRRGLAGGRTWESLPGECHHSTSGELGGLWRHRGRAPQRIFGVGFTSQGWDGHAPGYTVTEAGRTPAAAFIFEGVDLSGPVGEFGHVMGGAAGYEIDRADPDLGTPRDALVVATSAGRHSDHYQVTLEDVRLTVPHLGGTRDGRVRADMTYFRTPGGGSVFSVGSLCFSTSLPHNDYANDCSRIVSNVLSEFSRRSEHRPHPTNNPRRDGDQR